MKRVFDFVVALVALIMLAPWMAAIALAVKLGDGGPILFCQTRVGRFGKPFRIYKFRTMVVNAERLGLPITVARDPRITPVGHWLRRTKFDELPQLFNVVKGEMSLVGPRPEVPRYVALYDAEQRRVLELRPGITDPASIRYFDESRFLPESMDEERMYVERILPAKIRVNLAYADRHGLARDAVVIVQTVARICGITKDSRA